jgi:NAD(P)-dependent dehydrogenase (short-subunit alcohol dehydrogenase family)
MTMTLPKTPSFRLDDRRALVTGAGRGIGLAAAVALADAGAEVVLAARTEAEIEQAAAEIRASGGRASALRLDVLDVEAVAERIGDGGPFDILVNNAGTNRPMPMQDVTAADFDAVTGLNLRSAFFVAQAVTKGLIAAERPGTIIHVGSQMGHVGGANRSLYCATKWGLEGMSKAFALDLAGFGIRSNTIAPTFIETPMTKPFFEDEAFRSSVLAKIKLGRLGRVEDLMGAILYLACDASALVTGTSLVVDGGWTAD